MTLVDEVLTKPTHVVRASTFPATKRKLQSKANRTGYVLSVNIAVDTISGTASFDCLPREDMGTPPGRSVVFMADTPCELHFTEPAVFGTDVVTLSPNVPYQLDIGDAISGTSTYCYVVVGTTTPSALAVGMECLLMAPVLYSRGDPEVIVP